MVIDKKVLEDLLREAEVNPRRRMNLDLRTSPQDGSQRMLNAIWPDSVIPVHRHRETAETVLILMGEAVEVFYDGDGRVVEEVVLDASAGNYGMQVPVGAWHALRALTPCVIIEVKDGPYAPVDPTDLL